MTAQREFDAALGERLAQAREQSGQTREGIAQQAKALGLPWHRTTVGQIEQGKHGVSAYALTVAAQIFGITLAHLVDGLPNPSPAANGPCEAAAKAARRLGCSPGHVDSMARRLWGRSLTEEREARMGSAPRSRADQARRGHVTRMLIEQLRNALPERPERPADSEENNA